MGKTLYTKYGKARIYNGYYQITRSSKKENVGKLLHRLVFEDYHNCKLDKNDTIHHIDNNPLNNHPSNLICMSWKTHTILHNKYNPHSEETKQKISESLKGREPWNKGKNFSDETMIKMSKNKNTSGYFRVSKRKDKNLKQGYCWVYQYYSEDGKPKRISSVDIKKLEHKVKSKGLKWKKY